MQCRSNRAWSLAYVALAAIALSWLPGCGGHSGLSADGRATVSIQWPERGRLIPSAANFIRVRAYYLEGGASVGTQPPAVERPAPGQTTLTNIVIDALPVNAVVVFKAEAFADSDLDANGKKPLASGQDTLIIHTDRPNTFDINMASTVKSFEVTVSKDGTVQTPPYQLECGELWTVAAQGKDGAGATVLVADDKIKWTRSGFDAVTLNGQEQATGKECRIRGNNAQTGSILVNDSESGSTTSINVSVTVPSFPGMVDNSFGGRFEQPFPVSEYFGDIVAFSDGGAEKVVWLKTVILETIQGATRMAVWPDESFFAVVGASGTTPNYAERITSNTRGICVANPENATSSKIRTFSLSGVLQVESPNPMSGVRDVDAIGGKTYVLHTGGTRVTSLNDSDLSPSGPGSTISLPAGFVGRSLAVDDEGSMYVMGDTGAGTQPWLRRFAANGTELPFNAPANSIYTVSDLDFDGGLIYVADGGAGAIKVFSLTGVLLANIIKPEIRTSEYYGYKPTISVLKKRVWINHVSEQEAGTDKYLLEKIFHF